MINFSWAIAMQVCSSTIVIQEHIKKELPRQHWKLHLLVRTRTVIWTTILWSLLETNLLEVIETNDKKVCTQYPPLHLSVPVMCFHFYEKNVGIFFYRSHGRIEGNNSVTKSQKFGESQSPNLLQWHFPWISHQSIRSRNQTIHWTNGHRQRNQSTSVWQT